VAPIVNQNPAIAPGFLFLRHSGHAAAYFLNIKIRAIKNVTIQPFALKVSRSAMTMALDRKR
jgi:hypothetical protein